ncbi:Regulator of microtubule dynamics protein 1 [Platysternon megacephalum]|uniref:Regulator of microtubule dynamics protein 1 n=1 Tax=Platysternon megacephalum TaxID=55544 RepID=A0A4D9EUM4_9SAUR|nr:Regulator of microtubule dynamics protein 1 [Platysternon megacephalum]
MCPTRTLPGTDRSLSTQEPRSRMARTLLQTDRFRSDALTRFPRMQAGRAKHGVAHHGDSGYYPEVFAPRRRLCEEAAPVRGWRRETRLVAAGAVTGQRPGQTAAPACHARRRETAPAGAEILSGALLPAIEASYPPPPVFGKLTLFRRGLALSAVSYLGYDVYNSISHSAVVHASIKVEEIIEQADYLYGSGETKKLYQLLTQHKNSEDVEILWRLARASRDLAQLSSTSAEEKKQLVYEALEYAKKALEKNESSFAVHKWYAICISDVGDYEGIKTKIANAYVIKEHFQKAIELNPKDATSIHLMGIWCYSFAEMPWYQSKIAAMLFATPPTSTYEEVLYANTSDPNFYSKNLLLLGKTYLKLNNKKMALLWLTKTRDYPAHTEEDKQVQKEAVELLNSI